MKPEILAWVNKAEGDWETMLREVAVIDGPNLDTVCFHAQQCAEKYLKARLTLSNVGFRFSHDLLYLLDLVLTIETNWKFLHDSLFQLTAYAVASRYPGLDATAEQARRSVEHCKVVRETVRTSLLRDS